MDFARQRGEIIEHLDGGIARRWDSLKMAIDKDQWRAKPRARRTRKSLKHNQ